MSHWRLDYFRNRPLNYIGFGRDGESVRYILHVDKFTDLLAKGIEFAMDISG